MAKDLCANNEKLVAKAVRHANERRDQLTGVERKFGEEQVIVSKTDLKGRIVYANDLFVTISGFTECELIGAPHSILRHPAMPRVIFKALWEHLTAGKELFAYVVNRCKNGDHYWVLAHVTPTYTGAGDISGYHSNRRFPQPSAVAEVSDLYRRLSAIEAEAANPKDGMALSERALDAHLSAAGVSLNKYALTLGGDYR